MNLFFSVSIILEGSAIKNLQTDLITLFARALRTISSQNNTLVLITGEVKTVSFF